MSTIVYSPAVMTTVEQVSLCSSTCYIVKPYRPCSCTVSVTQSPSNVPNRTNIYFN